MLDSDAAGTNGFAGRPRVLATDRSALGRCVAVPDQDFAENFWATAPLLSHAEAIGQGFDDLFSAAAVDELISERGLRTPFLRMAKNGSVLAATTFTRSGGVGATIADQVADDKVLAQLAAGATLVLQALHRSWPPLIRFGTDLAVQLGHPVQINAYITPPENQGFAAHYDTHDVFVLQVAGSKRWKIHSPVIEDPLPHQTWEQRRSDVAARATQPPLIDTVLEPGDALYLPRGYLHSAVAQGDVSIHLTVGVHPLTAYDLARELIAAAATDRELRRSLPMGLDVTDFDAITRHVRGAADRLALAVATADDPQLAAVAGLVGGRQAEQTRPVPLAPLSQLAALRSVRSDTPLRLRRGLLPSSRRVGEQVLLHVMDSTISWPAQVDESLRLVVRGNDFRPVDLPSLDADEQLVVARRLLREGIVVPAVGGPESAQSD